jgi:hypothetical protein
MPSLQDIANQINNTLTQINTNTGNCATTEALIKGDTADIRNEINTLIGVTTVGFASLSEGLAKVIDEQKETNVLLDYERQQNDTIICWLTTIANLLCRADRDLEKLIEVETDVRSNVRVIRQIEELVHGEEGMEVLRRDELAAKLAKCCPDKPVDPPPCFQPCEEPPFRPYKPQVPDYKPLPQPTGTTTGTPNNPR